MAQYNDSQRFSRARTRCVRTPHVAPSLLIWPLLLALCTLLAGCLTTSQAPLGEWSYEFTLGHFEDKRPDDDQKMQVVQAFRIQDFMTGWHANMQRNLFANEPATLNVVLSDYNATRNDRSYALTMTVFLQGIDQYGREIATTHATCNAIEQRDLRNWSKQWGDFWQQPADQRDAAPLTLRQRDVNMWQKVMNTCVRQLALEFGNTLAARAPR